jgi:ribonucleoside-triphosphate reductase
MAECGKTCEVYSRVVGYIRPVGQWNPGKIAEWSERTEYQQKVDGDILAGMAVELLESLNGTKVTDIHAEADWLRTNGHPLAGELLARVSNMRDAL